MKTCACGNELVDSIDEFGDVRNPVCITCWLTPGPSIKAEDEIFDLEKDIESFESEISDLDDEISELRDEIRNAEKRIKFLRSGKQSTITQDKNRLKSWIKGEPLKDETELPVMFERKGE